MKTIRRRALVASVMVAALLVSCSDGGNATGGSRATDSSIGSADSSVPASALGTAPDDSSLISTSSTTIAGGATTSAPVSTGAGATTTLPAAPPTTDPFASTPEPSPEEPAGMPGPPADDCLDAPAGPISVELSFDDDTVFYAGSVAPSCVRIHAAQQLTLRSNSGAASLVLVGPDSYPMPAGAIVSTAALGTRYAVGEVFDVFVDHLDSTVVVQVLP